MSERTRCNVNKDYTWRGFFQSGFLSSSWFDPCALQKKKELLCMPRSLIFNDYIQIIASEIYKRKTRGSYAKLTQVELGVVSVVFSKEKQEEANGMAHNRFFFCSVPSCHHSFIPWAVPCKGETVVCIINCNKCLQWKLTGVVLHLISSGNKSDECLQSHGTCQRVDLVVLL